ncbi:M13 family metallopeptidase [uncultured Clostridium sp.]|uniref:M13 family metallopeptidase n=1 Tax=uncultured Clostridium sp. TaxID=59620 RepID=UPI0025CDEDAF|nr:M13 family metallopeptidase [uncultured Clostridium sp.]
MKNYKFLNRCSVLIVLIAILFQLFSMPLLSVQALSYQSTEKNQDIDVRLQDDFYTAINKEWIENTSLENGYVSYGTFEELCGKVNSEIHNIIHDINENKECFEQDSDELKVLNLYNNFLDMKKRNNMGKKPIEGYIKKIDQIHNIEDLRKIFCEEDFIYFQPLINIGVGADYRDSNMNVLYFGSSNLILGNSLYYKNDLYENIRTEYTNYIAKLHKLYGESKKESMENAERFYSFEEKISNDIPTYQEEAKDNNRLNKTYNVFTLQELEDISQNIGIENMLNSFNITNPNKIIVENPKNIKFINSLITEENLDDLKNYFKTIILLNTDNLLSDEFRRASSNLKKILYGVEVVDVSESSAVKFVTCNLCELTSRLYVNKCFDKECKSEVKELCNEIIDNYRHRLNNIQWMTKETKEKAIEKLDNMNVKIGYPDFWSDYNDLSIRSFSDGGTLVENIVNIYNFQTKRQFSKLGAPVNKSDWNMGACTVNAYYNPLNNEIVFPAAILQNPFYDKNASKEKNLGGIGAVIGHELTHAFDNIGAQFDENGQLNNWWTENDYKEFTDRSKKVINYYSNIEVEDGKYVNGALTVGENISDLGGIACVIDIAEKNENCNLKDLFENYAAIWREVSTKEIREYLLNNDPHSPKKVRVNGVLAQFEEFYKLYDIKPGDKMYVDPQNRVGIW